MVRMICSCGSSGRVFSATAEAEVSPPSLLNGESQLEHDVKDYDRQRKLFKSLLWLLNLLTIGQIGLIIYILFKWLKGFSLQRNIAELSDYNVHLVCTVFGLVIAPAYGMLLYRMFPSAKHSKITTIHAIFLTLTTFISVFGVKVSYESHHVYGNLHLYSLHAWFGVAITTLLFFCMISGNWMYLSSSQLPFMPFLHRISGVYMFIICIAASISGLLTRSQHLLRVSKSTQGTHVLSDRVIILNTLGLLISFFGLLARYLITDFRFRRRQRPGEIDEKQDPVDLLKFLSSTDTALSSNTETTYKHHQHQE